MTGLSGNQLKKSYLWQMGFDVGEARAHGNGPPAAPCPPRRKPDVLPENKFDVDTDSPIKLLFGRHAQSLLPFIGETNARVADAGCVTLQRPRREVDCVLRLERDGTEWYRHVEFESHPDPNVADRSHECNSRLHLHYDNAPVLTTVLYLLPFAYEWPGDAYLLRVGDRLAYEWHYDVVRLWEIPVETAFESGEAGPLALVPLLRGGKSPESIREAVRRLDALPRSQSADAMSALLYFASQHDGGATLNKMLGKDRVMQCYLWEMGHDTGEIKGRAEGEALGELRAARQICVDVVESLHPSVAKRVLPVIEACELPEALRAWIMACSKLSAAAFAAVVTGKPSSPQHSRNSRPSRRSVSLRKAR